MDDSRFIIGIDLGTTNIATYYIDTEKTGQIKAFKIEQLIAAGELKKQSLLPSFCYLPTAPEQQKNTFSLSWDKNPSRAVGTYARDHGAGIPNRLIYSAKSWLAHAGVNRFKPFLPWGSDLTDQMISPVEATASYLSHIRDAWNHQNAGLKDQEGNPSRFEDQQIVITIPASFDETARDLTIESAKQAGLHQLTLLEEPLAAFY